MQFKQHGFNAIIIVIFIVVVGGIGLTGWLVLKGHQDRPAAVTQAAPATISAASADTTYISYRYTSQTGAWSMNLPDGWQLTTEAGFDSIGQYGSAATTTKPGTKAAVTVIDGGKDGTAIGIFMLYEADASKASSEPVGQDCGSFTTAQGALVTCSLDVQDGVIEQGLGGLPAQGDKGYSYDAAYKGHSFSVHYGVSHDATDDHQLLEKAIKTLTFNK